MKTENEIAKENVEVYIKETKRFFTGEIQKNYYKGKIDEHLSTLKRWLEFLKKGKIILIIPEVGYTPEGRILINNKIADIKLAIKTYEGDKLK